jgi:hypothetical protein
MAYTTGQTMAQLAAALVTAGMSVDAANNAAATLSWLPVNATACPIAGILVKVTTSAVGGNVPAFSFDAAPS